MCVSKGKDFYTGGRLNWSLLSKYDNRDAHENGVLYMRKFVSMPSVDHYDGRGKLDFRICSWIVNDSKSHLSHADYVKLCKKVVSHSKRMMNTTQKNYVLRTISDKFRW